MRLWSLSLLAREAQRRIREPKQEIKVMLCGFNFIQNVCAFDKKERGHGLGLEEESCALHWHISFDFSP